MKYTEYEKVLVINYITKIAKGSTLSGVFAMQEATKYSNFIDFEKNSNVKRLNSGIQSYYEYIWKTATQQVGEIRYTIDMYLAATFLLLIEEFRLKQWQIFMETKYQCGNGKIFCKIYFQSLHMIL